MKTSKKTDLCFIVILSGYRPLQSLNILNKPSCANTLPQNVDWCCQAIAYITRVIDASKPKSLVLIEVFMLFCGKLRLKLTKEGTYIMLLIYLFQKNYDQFTSLIIKMPRVTGLKNNIMVAYKERG